MPGLVIQSGRNEKAFKRIQKKMMHTRSTLDWSQSSNIFCSYHVQYFMHEICLVGILNNNHSVRLILKTGS